MQLIPTRLGKVAVDLSGEGPPLVLLHSVGHDHHDYDAVISELGLRFRTIAVDFPGHGGSDMFDPPASATASGMADALEDVVSELGLSGVVLLGNSVGGNAALRLAARRPECVRGLVLVDSTGGLLERSVLARAFCWVQGRVAVRRLTGMAFARHYFRLRNEHVEASLARIAAAHENRAFVEMHAAMWRSFATSESDHSSEVAAVRAPTLIVWGRRDPVVRPSVEGLRTRRLLPHASYVELATGHAPFVEDPAAFLAALTPWLAALPAAEGDADVVQVHQAAS